MSEEQILINLKDTGNDVTIKDMNYEFAYRRVTKPDGNDSPYYTMFYREDGSPDWFAVNGLLSENFTACKTSAVIKHIQEQLKGSLAGERHWRDKTSVKSTFMLKGYSLDVGKPEPADVLIFKLITGVDIEEIDQRSGLGFHIINGFSGNLALQLNFGFITSATAGGQDGNDPAKLIVSNIFLLDEFGHRLIHDGRLKVEFAQVQDVKDQVSKKLEEFKKLDLDITFMDMLKKGFPKKFVKNFLNVFDKLPMEYQNMYYATYIFSALLEAIRNINMEINLRKFISGYIANRKLKESVSEKKNDD